MINKILRCEEISNRPPVLLDIGASGELHQDWRILNKHSICLAFDADERDMDYLDKRKTSFRKLHIYNSVVSDKEQREIDFYLTKSPYCSSTLKPDNESLRDYSFYELFEIEKKVQLKATNIKNVLLATNIDYIDWIKFDSQGTDLRLFKSLGTTIINKVIAAEFEPGIIDAYVGEDKFYKILSYMDKRNFWVSDIEIRGSQRINYKVRERLVSRVRENLKYGIRKSPGWASIVFLNNFKELSLFDKRDILLGWVISILQKQYGFALELANLGQRKFDDILFNEIEDYTMKLIDRKILKHLINKGLRNPHKIPLRIISLFK